MLFALGAAREHSIRHKETSHTESAVPATTGDTGETHSESGGESSTPTSTPEAAQHTQETSAEGRVLGVNLESWPLVAAAVIASIALALLLLRFPRRSILLVIGIFAGIAAIFDIAEVVHQIHDSQQLLTVIAIGVSALHAAALAIAIALSRPAPA